MDGGFVLLLFSRAELKRKGTVAGAQKRKAFMTVRTINLISEMDQRLWGTALLWSLSRPDGPFPGFSREFSHSHLAKIWSISVWK